jgi:hypothetical protein
MGSLRRCTFGKTKRLADLPKTSGRGHDIVTAQHNDYTGPEANIQVGNRQLKFPRWLPTILDVSTGRNTAFVNEADHHDRSYL